MNAPHLRSVTGGVELRVKLTPRASRNEIGPPQNQELRVKVTAPPVDSAANEALVQLLAERLGLPRGAVRLTRGQTSRHKSVFLAGLTVEEAAHRLTHQAGSSQCAG